MASILIGSAFVVLSENALLSMSQAAFVWDSTVAPAELAGLATGMSGSSSLSGDAAAGAAWVEDAVCRPCTNPATLHRPAKTARVHHIFIALPRSSSTLC